MNRLVEGRVQADSWGFEVNGRTNEADLLASEIKEEIYPLVHNGDYRSYYINACEIKRKPFSLRFYFEKGRLATVNLIPASQNPSWENVERDVLAREKQANDIWLQEELGVSAPETYPWGTVESIIDRRAGSSAIILRYKL